MHVKIGSIEIIDCTLDELDAIVGRYGLFTRARPGEEPPVVALPAGQSVPVEPVRDPRVIPGETAVIGGKVMTKAEVAALRERLAGPMPVGGAAASGID